MFTGHTPLRTARGTLGMVTAAARRWGDALRELETRLHERRARQPETPSHDVRAFVRAHPEYILVEERLVYVQEISRNPSSSLRHPPSGRVRIGVAYDGGACFGADARDDAEKILRHDDGPDDAVVGHLVFVEHEETDLDAVLGLAGTFGPYPVRIPIRSNELNAPETLTADRFRHQSDIAYRPPAQGPGVVPLQVIVDLLIRATGMARSCRSATSRTFTTTLRCAGP